MNSDDFLKSILQTNLILDCHTITITKKTSDNETTTFSGPGYISQNENGKLFFKIYCNTPLDPRTYFSQMNQFTSGKLIDDQHYYDLEAKDINGNKLSANSIIPQFSGGVDIEGCTVFGEFSKLFGVNDNVVKARGTLITIYYRDKFKIPSNIVRKTETTVGKESRGGKSEYSVAQFDTGEFDFEIFSEEDCTMLVIYTKNDLEPTTIIQRANEALHFATSLNYPITAVNIRKSKINEFIIFEQQMDVINPRLFPPISISKVDRDGHFGKLYCAFFNYCIKNETDEWHPLYKHIYNIIESSKASIDIQALTISVSVEGILKYGFSNIAKPTSETLNSIDLANSIISNSKISELLIPRIVGALGAMKHSRAKDKLLELENNGSIDQKLLKAWNNLRNSTAHSAELKLSKLQKFINDIHSVQVLFNLLVFQIIEYKGIYTDYSTYNFPEKNNTESAQP